MLVRCKAVNLLGPQLGLGGVSDVEDLLTG